MLPGMKFKPHPKAEERKRSAVTLIKYVLAARQPDILPAHRQELLGILLCKLTEAESVHKHRTRFQSEGALARNDKTKLQHEHVYQQEKMVAALEEAKPHEIDDILRNAVGCTVTVEEHRRLSKFDKDYGWDRYRKAGIKVKDTGE
jgi:hypothetical protein